MNVSKICLLMCLSTGALVTGCNKSTQPTSQPLSQASSAKHYQLKGKVVSVDKQSKMLNVDAEEIPGFMSAMTMPYQVKPASEVDKLNPGDSISADLLVQDDSAWLQNITVTGQSNGNPKK